MPTPNKGESEQAFVSRCMNYPDMQRYEPKQRAAICYSKFRGEAVHPDFQRIIGLFFKRYKVEEAIDKFTRFITRNGLNLSKAYNPETQFKESFEWVEPLIRPYKEDKEAKYYLVTALTADISMNNMDYGPEDRLAREDSSMNWRPVNIDHDYSKWLPYPRTRVDFSAANEFTLETTLRVDNKDQYFQRQLDHDPTIPQEDWINHPSIEGRPHPIGGRYHFTAMAFLRKGYELPGSPLTEIVPLVFNESVGKSVCEFKGGKMVCECETKQSEVKNNLKESVIKETIKEVLREAEYEPPESGDLPEAGKKILANAYASCRENNPDYEKERCSKIAWGAVHNAGYVKSEDGSWHKEQAPRSDAERAKAHFNISDEEWDKLSEEEKQAYIDKLPPRGSAEMKEQEVPEATNAPSTVAKDDTATCPEGQHWDDEAGKCVDDVMEECEAGWHFDTALQKCVPDNPQVNEKKAVSDLRLENAKLRVDLIHTNDRLKEYMAQINHYKGAVAEKNLEITQHLKENATLEGRISEKETEVRKIEARMEMLNNEVKDFMRRNHNLGRDVEDKDEKITVLQENLSKLGKNRDAVLLENQKLIEENLRASTNLTDIRNKEVQWDREKKEYQEGLAKALKHQKYVYEFLKSKGFEIVGS